MEEKRNKHSLKTLEGIFLQGIRLQRHNSLKKTFRLLKISRHAVGSWLKRKTIQRREGFMVPIAIAFSPTMRCNLSCIGCYAKDYPRNNELSLSEIDDIFTSAEQMGVFLFVITGGEPLLKDGILEVFQRHQKMLFLMITNGLLMDEKTAELISRAGNIITVVSIEGTEEQTDHRRGNFVYHHVKKAMDNLQKAGATFGFSTTVTRENFDYLVCEQFIEEMLNRGCALGFYTEYIPVGSAARWEMLMEDDEQRWFRERLLEIRRTKPLMPVHLPDDEYAMDNKCAAVMGGCFHINAQGYAEPCPFTHFASDNVRDKGLEGIMRSEFLAQIRASEAIVRRGRVGCALFENREVLETIAFKTGAKPTDRPVFEETRIGGE
jgi:MoaA/NifB/PqqE/SkfB family radical SAM enzyme